jgi:hypothetical protein
MPLNDSIITMSRQAQYRIRQVEVRNPRGAQAAQLSPGLVARNDDDNRQWDCKGAGIREPDSWQDIRDYTEEGAKPRFCMCVGITSKVTLLVYMYPGGTANEETVHGPLVPRRTMEKRRAYCV